ncbi:hypothetical protein JST56_00690 [Candidatus Dependentiae bacterium]|jgi:hypothetical protein|nr:hypothetical protein [Candidatus Dependentiae bacterium]
MQGLTRNVSIVFLGMIGSLISMTPDIAFQNQELKIEFCIADIKYNDNALKILEFGGGPRSGFEGYDASFGFGAMWTEFWKYLAQFNRPMWYIKTPIGEPWISFMGAKTFTSLGGRFALNSDEVQHLVSQLSSVGPDGTYSNYNGIFLINKRMQEFGPIYDVLKQKYPSAVFINEIANNFIFNKSKTDRLFRDDELRQYRPQSMVCLKRYDAGLAQKIINTMQCNMFVIKPLNAQYGKGIIFVKKEELDSMLKTILVQVKDTKHLRVPLAEAIAYWSEDNNSRFMIEEYIPSKLVELEGKKYDATLRAVFAMHCLNRKITITVLGAYWKLPVYGVDDQFSLNDVHQSSQHDDREVYSLPVDPLDMERIRAILTTSLTRVYAKMITQIKK